MHASSTLFALLELPFLLFCVVIAFLTARSLRGGVFGRGMSLIAWGFLVMAIGHLIMQIEVFSGVNLLTRAFGETGGSIAWFLALVLTWSLSGIGFMSLYRASRSG